MLMFSLVLRLKPSATGGEKRKGAKQKAILEIHSLRRHTTSVRVIKYLLGIFGHCTLLILDRRAFCHKPYYSDSEQEVNLTETNVGGEKEISGQGNLHKSSLRLAIDLAEHNVLCACQDEMGLNENVKDTQMRVCTRESATINSPMMATTSASMCPWAILSRPA